MNSAQSIMIPEATPNGFPVEVTEDSAVIFDLGTPLTSEAPSTVLETPPRPQILDQPPKLSRDNRLRGFFYLAYLRFKSRGISDLTGFTLRQEYCTILVERPTLRKCQGR